MASTRRFGVEIEHGNDLGYHYVQSALRGFMPSWFRGRTEYEVVGSDGSGVEVRSPILQGKEGLRELREVMLFLQEIGGYVTERDGMHVHHDAPEFVNDKERQLRLVKSWVANDAIIDAFVAPDRRDGGPCRKAWKRPTRRMGGVWDSTLYDPIKVLEEQGEILPGRGDLNLRALHEHGTVEIRLHEGTLDPDEAEAWVRLGQNFLDNISRRKRVMQCRLNEEQFVKQMRLPKAAREVLLRKAENGGVLSAA